MSQSKSLITEAMVDKAMDAWLSIVNVPGSADSYEGFWAALEVVADDIVEASKVRKLNDF